VTYPVVVSVPNPNLDLLPGMTASLSFQVDQRADVVKITKTALRFYTTAKQVRTEDVPILEGRAEMNSDADQDNQPSMQGVSVGERNRIRKEREKRHVWVVDGDRLRAVVASTGMTDGQFTELLQGDLKPGDELVTGIKPTDQAESSGVPIKKK
jgi:HlyD family secretion protein